MSNEMELVEPSFDEINGINVVRPEVRFPTGSYVALGVNVGVVFPGQILGPKGIAMRSAVAKLTKILEGFMGDVALTNSAKMAELEKSSEPFVEVFRLGLLFNYTEKTTQWILDNIQVDIKSLLKIYMTVCGEEVDTDLFRGKPIKI